MLFAIDWKRSIKMESYNIHITELAEEDLEAAGEYIAFTLLNPSAAVRTVRGIRNAVDGIGQFPAKHALEEDPFLASLGIRRTYFENYKIYYIVDETSKTITVIRILHMLVDSKRVLYQMFHV